ncbi:MAG: ABC transporter ATP-binding protein [Bdellovibrionales bacterium]|nr:ABC transporter ATP-binding protein [Bdellovibrionales bacterium]
MQNHTPVSIKLNDVSLVYDLHHDRTNNLKEYIVNLLSRRSYVDKRKDVLHALNHINLEINEGDRLGIIGLNGAGKSTLLKVISGILKPTSGEIIVHGHVQPLIEIGAGFDPEFTGRENIYLNGYMLGFTKKQIQAKEQEIIDFTELGHFIDTPIKYYSSGMSVRLAFTIATMIEPEVLVFDEMLSAGDAVFIQKAQKRLNAILDKAKIIVLVSHDLNMIKNLCNKAIVVNKGEIQFLGPTQEAIDLYLKNTIQ